MSSDSQRIAAIMKENCLHAYLATTHDDQPFVRPVSPIVEDDMTIWLTTFFTSRKVSHIGQNPKMCLAFVEQPQGDKAAFVFGEAHVVSDIEKKKRVWQLARFDLSQHFPDGPESKELCLLRIFPKKIEWRESWEAGNKIFEPTQV
ncbi:MAG: pyridoxamine 5'-phosphate oxidase family protein [Candidatus Bathyarchaeia archaeon]